MNLKATFNTFLLACIFLLPFSCQKKVADKINADAPSYPTKDGVIVNTNPASPKTYPTKDGVVPNQNAQNSKGPITAISIIPQPKVIELKPNRSKIFSLKYNCDLAALTPHATTLLGQIGAQFAKDIALTNASFELSSELKPESYSIVFGDSKMLVSYGDNAGLQYAIQTIHDIVKEHGYPLLQGTISDSPSFAYRGMHLDVSRHFFNVDEVKKYIDYLAQYKYNRFHWHLTDDQGWRIEIKKYPRLTEVGGYRDGTLIGHYNDQPHKFTDQKYGGFYTQDQIVEVVKYATARSITVIPEIEMPGHALAALASFAELSCEKKELKVAQKWGVFDDVFCPTAYTFEFLQNVLDEVVTLFPSKHIHIGGDECPKDAWKKSEFCQQLIKEQNLKDEHELQAYFIKRIGKYLNETHNRTIIGWDEILEGGLTDATDKKGRQSSQMVESAQAVAVELEVTQESSKEDRNQKPVIMSWRGIEGGVAAAKAQHKAIMTPGSHCYFDHYQSQKSTEPVAIGGYTDVRKVYEWEVIPKQLNETERQYIIGGQANVWTEYIPTFAQVEYMAYARGLAMSEVLWGSNNNYLDFLRRYDINYELLKSHNINIANHIYELKPKITSGNGATPTVLFDLPTVSAIKHLINDAFQTVATSDRAFDLSQPGQHVFRLENRPQEEASITVVSNLAAKAKISITPLPSTQYGGNGIGSIVNGVLGATKKYGGTEWLGFEGKSPVIDLDLGSAMKVSSLELRFFKGEGQWIYLPKGVEISTSSDGKNYKVQSKDAGVKSVDNIQIFDMLFMEEIRYFRIKIQNYGVIPAGKQGGGHGAWLFVDEIVVK